MGLEKFRQFLHVGFAKSPPLIDVPDHGVAGLFQGAIITEPFPLIAVFVALGGFSIPGDDLQVGGELRLEESQAVLRFANKNDSRASRIDKWGGSSVTRLSSKLWSATLLLFQSNFRPELHSEFES